MSSLRGGPRGGLEGRRGSGSAFSATNLTRALRGIWIGLFARYEARVEIVAIEADPEVILSRNRKRDRPVPDRAIERMLSRWEAPSAIEAHALRWVC